jgi:hypothetical protein
MMILGVDADGRLAIEHAPDAKVVRYIMAQAEAEGIEIATPENKTLQPDI